MRIAIMAAGAVGAYFGARWVEAGHDVFFIARGAHLDAIRKNGLQIDSVLGDTTIRDANVTDDPKTVGPVDVVLFAVKLWDTESAAELTRPLVGADTRVITVQNGVDGAARLAPILGDDVTVGGSTYIVTTIAAPGVIRHGSKIARIVCGRMDGRADPALERYGKALQAPRLELEVTSQMALELWKKFVLLSGTSSITAGTRKPFGAVLADSEIRALFLKLMGEAVTVGRAAGVALPPDYADQAMAIAAGFPPEMRASMAHDLERGNRLELDWLAGKVSALGRDLKVPTPANDTVYALLKPYRMGKAG